MLVFVTSEPDYESARGFPNIETKVNWNYTLKALFAVLKRVFLSL